MRTLERLLKEQLSGVFVYSARLSNNIRKDRQRSYFGNVKSLKRRLKRIPELQGGFHAIGISQAGQFLRAYVERYNDPPVKTLITVGSQHQGIALPGECVIYMDPTPRQSIKHRVCELMATMHENVARLPFIQKWFVPAQYYKNPFYLNYYKTNNKFLQDINNEGEEKNPKYKRNLASLHAFVMVKHLHEAAFFPPQSSWFGYFDGYKVQKLREQTIYQEDWIGLKQLDQEKKLHFLDHDGTHAQVDESLISLILPFISTQKKE